MNITRENIDELNAVVKVDIAKEDYSEKVDKILKDYRKNANIPGFRKGQVPMGMVKKQYGKAVLVDEVNKMLQDALNKYLTEEKLDVLGNPLPKEQENFDWEQENYSFEFELGLSPQFEVNFETKKPITHYKIVAGEEMIQNQIKHLQKQYGKLISKDVAEEGDSDRERNCCDRISSLLFLTHRHPLPLFPLSISTRPLLLLYIVRITLRSLSDLSLSFHDLYNSLHLPSC
jgi:trigger factor